MHKKLLSVLLALVMILSVLPMAAFAEEAEHTHDENCGCADTAAYCSHPQIVLTTKNQYIEYTDTYHSVKTTYAYICSSCGAIASSTSKTDDKPHVMSTISRVDSGTFEGDWYEVYKYLCACGYYYYKTVWQNGPLVDGWFKP